VEILAMVVWRKMLKMQKYDGHKTGVSWIFMEKNWRLLCGGASAHRNGTVFP